MAGTSRSTVSHLTSSTGCGAKEAGDEIFFDVGRSGDDGGESDGGIGADGDRDFHFAAKDVTSASDLAAGGAGHDDRRRHASFAPADGSQADSRGGIPVLMNAARRRSR